MGTLTMSAKRPKSELIVLHWRLFICFVSLLNVVVFAQTSPKGTFRIETYERFDEDPTAGVHEQQFVVSMADSKVREPLGEERQDQPATYFISPDEQWIFATVYYGSRMGGARLYQRKKDFKFERVMDEKSIWKFFEQQALAGKKRPSGWGVEIVDFIAWSPDSARVLFSLRRGNRVTGKGSFGYYGWHAYYNVRSGKFELTDYLHALNRSAHKLRPEDEEKEPAATALAEPLAELPPETELKKRAEEVLNELLAKLNQKEQARAHNALDWIKTQEPGAKFYAKFGPKATAGRRYWQYMFDSAENRLKSLESDYGYLIPPPEQAWDHFAGIWRGDTAADVKKLFGEPLPNETNAGSELRYFDGALVVTCDKQTQRVRSVCLDLSTETFQTQWRAASAKRHLYELQWASYSRNYESLRKVFGPKLEKHSTERGETFDYAYSPRTTVSWHPNLQDGNCSTMCVLWKE
jgi:hypothetical protein